MTEPGPGPAEDPDSYFAPPRPGQPPPPPPQWYVPARQRSRRSEVLLKVLAGVAIVTFLGFAAMAVFVVLAVASYGDNK